MKKEKKDLRFKNVGYVLPDVAHMIPVWKKIDAAIEGQDAVKALGEAVLPKPNPEDKSEENAIRYRQYLRRAMYYNVPGRTLHGMAGYVFAKEPVAELPETLKGLIQNVDGTFVTLHQQAKETFRCVMSKARAGLLVDFPTVDNAVAQDDLNKGAVLPRIVLYKPEQIINYDFSDESQTKLNLLVLKETKLVNVEGDMFEKKELTQYRVLYLNDKGLQYFIVQEGESKEDEPILGSSGSIKGHTGADLKEIPFVFVGAQLNNSQVQAPPLKDLVDMALSHFCNSADYEESCFIVGQPTPFFAGLTKQWVDEVLNGRVEIGARAAVLLPLGGTAGLLQADPNSLPFEAMEKKEKQMIAIGAKLVEERSVQRTATEAGLDHASDASVLVTAAQNVFNAYQRALEFCTNFVPASNVELSYDLAESLTKDNLDAPQAVALMELWNAGALGFEEIRFKLRQAGLAYMPDEKVKAEGEQRRKEEQEAAESLATAKGTDKGAGASRKEVKKAPVKKKD